MSAEDEAIESKPSVKETKSPAQMTSEEVKEMIRALAEKLGHPPSIKELEQHTPLRRRYIRSRFGSLTSAFQECGISYQISRVRIPIEQLFLDWAGAVRQMKKVPTITEFAQVTKLSVHPYHRRFRRWSMVPDAMRDYMKVNGLAEEWADVMDAIRVHYDDTDTAPARKWPGSPRRPLTVKSDRPVYGTAMVDGPLVNEPTNEAGVIFLFGARAMELGFRVTLIQTAFPDCEALREVEPGRWQKMRIELEYESRNFLRHGHRAEDCDLIVCWIDNWPECPLEVVELKTAIS